MHEDLWIDAIRARFGVPPGPGRIGPGDDAAVWTLGAGEVPVLTVDVIVEGVHFRRHWLTDAELGARAVLVSASDISAMAATPRGVLLAVETPELPGRVGEDFWDGVAAALDDTGMALLGGNVTRTPGPLAISCTVLGGVTPGAELRRDGARAGDGLWVTGLPGRAAAARRAIEEHAWRPDPGARCPWRRPPVRAALARRLRPRLHAGIDISDGLGLDLSRLLRDSGVGARLDLAPLLERLAAVEPAVSPDDVLDGGEDYELILIGDGAGELDDPQTGLTAETEVTRIGEIVDASGIIRIEGASEHAYTPRGWDPFRGPPPGRHR